MIMLFFMLLFTILGFAVWKDLFIIVVFLLIIDICIYIGYRSEQTSRDNCIKIKFKDILKLYKISPDKWHYGSYHYDWCVSMWYSEPVPYSWCSPKVIFHMCFSYLDWKWFHIWKVYNDYNQRKKENRANTIEFLQICQEDVDKKYKEATALLEKGTKQMKEVMKHE